MNTQLTPQYITTTTHSHGQLPPNVVYLNAQGQIVTPHQNNETRLHDLKEGLKKDKKKYKKNVAVAATTACYFWLPLGLIPAVVVAAVFGSRAASKYDDVRDKKKEIAQLEKYQYVTGTTKAA